MFRFYSKGCEYAMQALTCMSPLGSSELFCAKALCEKAHIPEPFTRKVFRTLVEAGLLRAVRGPHGGYSLTRHPSRIPLLEIVRAVDGDVTFAGCIMGLKGCNESCPCPLHRIWFPARADLLARLESETLQDLMETVRVRGRSRTGSTTMKEGSV